MASMAAFVYFWSSAYEVSGGCATDTVYPSFSRILATASQPEPSANAPCTRTTFLMPLGDAAAATPSSSRIAPISVAASKTMLGLFCVDAFIGYVLLLVLDLLD